MKRKNTSVLDRLDTRVITQVTGKDNGTPGIEVNDEGNFQKLEGHLPDRSWRDFIYTGP